MSALEILSPDPAQWRGLIGREPARSFALSFVRVRRSPDYLAALTDRVEAQTLLPLVFHSGGNLIAVALVEVHTDRGCRTLHILELAGRGVVRRIREFEAHARRLGAELDCSLVTLAGREGWGRLFEPLGWRFFPPEHLGVEI